LNTQSSNESTKERGAAHSNVIGIYMFDGVEVLDFAGPFEVFTTAARMHARSNPDAGLLPLFQVVTIAATAQRVVARGGLPLVPDCVFASHPHLDVLIVPGGVVDAEMEKRDVGQWIGDLSRKVKVIASVCTGAFLLAKSDVVKNERVTTHWEDIDLLRSTFPGLIVESNVRWVDEGRVVTSAGITAGIDMCLHLVEVLAGRVLAERTALQMEFDWRGNSVENAA
jgi:transcriptional regulator GlxA family with amidase domain